MSAEGLRVIVDGLNSPPFNRNLTMVKLDSMSANALLQTLSDVIGWVEGQTEANFVDIRSEAPDETMTRLLSALRVLKYPPPRDIDQIQRWRLELLEGQKSVVFPILEWIFANVDRLKERVYLASYLTRVEVQLEHQSPEVVRLMNAVEQKMEEFKELHAQNVEARMEYMRAMDVSNDLKAMEEEREQLQRKIERCKRRLAARRPDLNNLLGLAAQHRLELERSQELQIQGQGQQKAIKYAEQRIARLERALGEVERRQEGADPKAAIQRMKREMEVNRYLLNEKLEQDLRLQRNNLEVVQRILAQRNATKADVDKLKEQIEQLNSECMELALQRDRRDETSEDKLVVYRHQAVNTQRKKANVADELQQTKQELDNIETLVTSRKRELGERLGKDEVVTSVQYRTLLNKLLNKSNTYKRKKTEMEQLKAEQQILERTLELLEERFEQIKEANQNEGRGVIDFDRMNGAAINSVNQRPKTAKPDTTDVDGLKRMVKQIGEQINARRDEVTRLNAEIESFHLENKAKNERFYSLKAELDALEENSLKERRESEEKIGAIERKLSEARKELERSNLEMQRHKWLAENSSSAEQAEYALQQLEVLRLFKCRNFPFPSDSANEMIVRSKLRIWRGNWQIWKDERIWQNRR
uniref:G protein gamma domain-containing protein n=1 Tax=Globodera pallida TaxID=36090 RepID=A0A183C809_GLOPA